MADTLFSSSPLLSFCLPTYNRAALLEQALAALLTQIRPEEAADVEVVVVDNASPDGTPNVVRQAGLQSPHVALRSVRNSDNIGPDRNFLKAIDLAQGKFVFLISDDDLLLPGAVAKLLELIHEHPGFDGFCLNIQPFKHDPSEARMPLLDLPQDAALHSRDRSLELLGTLIGFMSILAFNKSIITGNNYTDRIGTNFIQSFLFLDVLSNEEGLLATAQPFLAQRTENAMGLNYFRVFVTSLHTVLAYAQEKGYSRKVIQRIEAKNLVAVRHFVSSVKLHGLHADLWPGYSDAIRRLFLVYGFRPYLWLVVVPLMFFPAWLRPLIPKLRELAGRSPSSEAQQIDKAKRINAMEGADNASRLPR